MKKVQNIQIFSHDRSLEITLNTPLMANCERIKRTERLETIGETIIELIPFSEWATSEPTVFVVGRILRITYSDATFSEFRVVGFERSYDGSSNAVVHGWSIVRDLYERVVSKNLLSKRIDYNVVITNLTAQQALDELMNHYPTSDFIAGNVYGFSGEIVNLITNGNTFGEVLEHLCEQLRNVNNGERAEFECTWNGTAYEVNIESQIGWSEGERLIGYRMPELRPLHGPLPGKYGNRQRVRRVIDGKGVYNRIVPLGQEIESPLTIGFAEFECTNAVQDGLFTDLTLDTDLLYSDNAPSKGIYIGNDVEGFAQIVSTTALTSIVRVYGNKLTWNSKVLRFAIDANGSPLTYLDDIDSVDAYGVKEKVVVFGEIPPYENLLVKEGASCDMSTFDGGVPSGSLLVGNPTVSVESGDDYVRYGTQSARVQGGKNEGLAWELEVDVTAESPFLSIWVGVRVENGQIRVEFEDSAGNIIPEGEDKAVSSVNELRAITIEGIDPQNGTGTLRVVGETTAVEFIVDAITVVQSSSAYEYHPYMGPKSLWKEGLRVLNRDGGFKVENYTGDWIDVSAIEGGKEPIILGSYVQVNEHYDGAIPGLVFNGRVVGLEYQEQRSGAIRKRISLERPRRDIYDQFRYRDKKPKLKVAKPQTIRHPLLTSANAYLGAYDEANGGFPIYISFSGNNYVKSVAWIWQTTEFETEPTLANWQDAVSAGNYTNGSVKSGVEITSTGNLLPPGVVGYIRVMAFSKINGGGILAPNAVPLQVSTRIEPTFAVVVFQQTNNGYLKLYVNDPFQTVESVQMRSVAGGNFESDSIPMFTTKTKQTDADGDFYSETVQLDTKHTSIIEYKINMVGDLGTIRNNHVFDFDQDPKIIDATLSFEFNSSTELFDVKLNWIGDEDTASVKYAVSPYGYLTPVFGANGRIGQTTVLYNVDFGEKVYARVQGCSDVGGSGNQGQFYFDFEAYAPDNILDYLPNGGILAEKLVASAQGVALEVDFSTIDASTVGWSSGSIKLADGSIYAIASGTTGTMTGKRYIYWDKSSPLGLQVTDSYQSSIGDNKILIAVAKNGDYFPFLVPVNSPDLLVNSANINVLNLQALSADMGSLTAGEILLGNQTTFSGTFTGIRIYKTGSTYRVAGYNNGNLMAYINSDGKLYGANGDVWIDDLGLNFKKSTLGDYIRFWDGAVNVAGITYQNSQLQIGSDNLQLATSSNMIFGSGNQIQFATVGGMSMQVNNGLISLIGSASSYQFLTSYGKLEIPNANSGEAVLKANNGNVYLTAGSNGVKIQSGSEAHIEAQTGTLRIKGFGTINMQSDEINFYDDDGSLSFRRNQIVRMNAWNDPIFPSIATYTISGLSPNGKYIKIGSNYIPLYS